MPQPRPTRRPGPSGANGTSPTPSWHDGVEHLRRQRLQEELRGILFGPERSRDRRTQIREWAAGRFEARPTQRALVENALPDICHPAASKIRSTGHTERSMRDVNRRTDMGVRWTERGAENPLRLRLAWRNNPGDYARVWEDQLIELTVEVHVSQRRMSTV